MKLRRRRKEKSRSPAITCSAIPSQAATIVPAPLPLPFILSSSFPFSLPPPSLTSQHPSAPACQPPRVGRARLSSYPSPSCPASPFLLHKITEAEERGEKDRGGAPSLPTQLFYLTITGRAQLGAPCSFIQSVAAASLRFQWHPLCGGWSHRKTKDENELSCFITFIDE